MYIIMVVITLVVVFPLVWMLMLSFKSNAEILSNPLALPKSLNLDNFIHAAETLNFVQLYANTFFVCAISIIIELTITFLVPLFCRGCISRTGRSEVCCTDF